MTEALLVELSDGTLVRKLAADLKPEDVVVFDGPDAFRGATNAQSKLDAEIEAAGGLEAWQALSAP